jgi:hypothetical protein
VKLYSLFKLNNVDFAVIIETTIPITKLLGIQLWRKLYPANEEGFIQLFMQKKQKS